MFCTKLILTAFTYMTCAWREKKVGGCDISKISKAYVKPGFSQHCKFFGSEFISTTEPGSFELRMFEIKGQNILQNSSFIVILSYN